MGFGRPRRIALRLLLLLAAAGGAVFPLSASAQQLAAGPAAKPAAARVSETGLKGDRARTRFIIGLERTVEFQVFSLTNPNRVFVELPDVMLQLPPSRARRPSASSSRSAAASRLPARPASSSMSQGP